MVEKAVLSVERKVTFHETVPVEVGTTAVILNAVFTNTKCMYDYLRSAYNILKCKQKVKAIYEICCFYFPNTYLGYCPSNYLSESVNSCFELRCPGGLAFIP